MSEKKYIPIGMRLKQLRTTLHGEMSIKQYTDFLDIGYTRYLNWESGLNRPMPEEAEVLCDKLAVNMDFIYRGIDAQLPHNILIALSSIPRDSAHNKSKDTPD